MKPGTKYRNHKHKSDHQKNKKIKKQNIKKLIKNKNRSNKK